MTATAPTVSTHASGTEERKGDVFRPGLRDILSLEGALAFFFLSGAFKSEGVDGSSFAYGDPTLIAWVLMSVLALIRFTGGIGPFRVYQLQYLMLSLLAAAVVSASAIFLGEIQNEKFYFFLALNLYPILIGIFLVNTRARVWSFGRACMILAFAGVAASLLDFSGASVTDRQLLGAEGYQWVSRAAFVSATISAGMFIYDRNNFRRALYLVIAAVGLYSLLLSGGRQGVLALGVGLAVLGVTAAQGQVRKRVIMAAALLAVVVVGGWFLISSGAIPLWSLPRGVQRIWMTLAGGYENNRLPLYAEGIRVWLESPVFGVGWGRFVEESSLIVYRHPHNIFIESLAELGVLGGIVFGALIATPIFKAVRELMSRGDAVLSIMLATSAGMLAAVQTSGDIVGNRLLFFLLLMLLHLACQSRVWGPAAMRPVAPLHAQSGVR